MDNIQSKKIGLIKWFGNKKTNENYGFISDITNTEYFFHYQYLSQKVTSNKNFSIEKDLVQDRIVFFEPEKKPKGDIAKNIVLLEYEDDINLLFTFYIDLKLTGQIERSCFVPLEKKIKDLSNTFSTETYNQLLNKFKEIVHKKMQNPYATTRYLKDIILIFFQKNINDLEFDSACVFSSKDKVLLHLKGFDIKFSVSDYKQCKAELTSEQNNKLIDEICSNKNYTLENLLDIFDFSALEISNQIYILETFKKYSIDYKKISNFISKENSFLLYKYFDIEFDICSYKEYIFSTGDENNIKNFISEFCSCNKFNMDDLCKILDINNIDFKYQKYVFDITQKKGDFNKILEFVTLDKTKTYLWLKYPQLKIQFNRKFIEFINDFSVEEQSLFIKKIFFEISKNKTTTDIFNDIKSNYDSMVLVLYIIKDIFNRNSKNEKINEHGILQQFLSYLLEKYKKTKDINSDYLRNSIENINFFNKCYGAFGLEKKYRSYLGPYIISNFPTMLTALNTFHYFCDGRKEKENWYEKQIKYFEDKKYSKNKNPYQMYLNIEPEIKNKDRWKCSTFCFKATRCVEHNIDNLESFNLIECFNLINISVPDEEYCIYAGIANKIRIYIPHLFCKKCGSILKFNTENNYAAERITHFICEHCSTGNPQDDDIYINHCSNSNCLNVIDSRESAKCKSDKNPETGEQIGFSRYVCNYCLDCCSNKTANVYNDKYLISEGHLEKAIICCPKCGEHLTTYENYYNTWNKYLATKEKKIGITKDNKEYYYYIVNFTDEKKEIILKNEDRKKIFEKLLSGKIIESDEYKDKFIFIPEQENKNIFLVCENPECLNIIEYDKNDKYVRTNTIKMRHHLFFKKNEKSNQSTIE